MQVYKNDKIPYHLEKHGITYRKIRERPNIFHAIMVTNALQPYILFESHNALVYNASIKLYNFIRSHH